MSNQLLCDALPYICLTAFRAAVSDISPIAPCLPEKSSDTEGQTSPARHQDTPGSCPVHSSASQPRLLPGGWPLRCPRNYQEPYVRVEWGEYTKVLGHPLQAASAAATQTEVLLLASIPTLLRDHICIMYTHVLKIAKRSARKKCRLLFRFSHLWRVDLRRERFRHESQLPRALRQQPRL